MKIKTKHISAIIVFVIAVGVVGFLVNGDVLQGRLFRIKNTLYQKFVPMEEGVCYDSDGGQNYTEQGATYIKKRSNIKNNIKNSIYRDYCNGDTLIEYYCENNRVERAEIELAEVCLPTLNSIVQEYIPSSWINDFDANIEIIFEPLVEGGKDENGNYVEISRIEFTEEEQELITRAVQKAIYSMNRIDSYFERPLPWTEGRSYYDWIKGNLNTIKFKADPDQTGGWANVQEGTIGLSGYIILEQIQNGSLEAFSYQFPEALEKNGIQFLIGIITHEVRHIDEVYHSTCRGNSNMDENLRMMGAHGVNVLWRHWIKNFLPESMVRNALEENSHRLSIENYIGRMCSLDTSTGELEPEDQQWVMDISGFSLEYDRDILW